MSNVWTSGGDLNTAEERHAGAGEQNSGLSFGGSESLATTEEYNGTSWSAGGDLGTGRDSLGGCGSQNAALSIGGMA